MLDIPFILIVSTIIFIVIVLIFNAFKKKDDSKIILESNETSLNRAFYPLNASHISDEVKSEVNKKFKTTYGRYPSSNEWNRISKYNLINDNALTDAVLIYSYLTVVLDEGTEPLIIDNISDVSSEVDDIFESKNTIDENSYLSDIASSSDYESSYSESTKRDSFSLGDSSGSGSGSGDSSGSGSGSGDSSGSGSGSGDSSGSGSGSGGGD